MDIFEAAKDFGAFPSAIVTGLMLGAVFDVFACLRCFVPVHKAVLFACDMMYMLFFGFSLFTLCAGCEGRLRYYIAAGALTGAVCFHLAAGRFARRACESFALRVKAFIRRRKERAQAEKAVCEDCSAL